MNNPTATAPATSPREIQIQQAVEKANQLAIEKAAASNRLVTDVRGIQKAELKQLFEGGDVDVGEQGSEPSAENVSHGLSDEGGMEAALKEAIKKADAESDKREEQTKLVKDAKVGDLGGDTVGLQTDGTKEIKLDKSVIGTDLATKVTKHELEHRRQEDGDAKFSLPPTGNPVIDAQRKGIRRLAFRERGSMEAEGGVHAYTSRKYIEQYWNVAGAVRDELNKRGHNGEQMMKDAGRTMDGFRQVHKALVVNVMRNPGPNGSRNPAEVKPEFDIKP
jgi:hypothetical protein